jgi:hypothetical protein
MTYSAPARQRKPTLWDSQVAVCRRLGMLSCAERVDRLTSVALVAIQLPLLTVMATRLANDGALEVGSSSPTCIERRGNRSGGTAGMALMPPQGPLPSADS